MEEETEGSISFLDVHVKKDGRKLVTSVYQMNLSFQQIVLINAPESDRIVTSSSRISTIRNPYSNVWAHI